MDSRWTLRWIGEGKFINVVGRQQHGRALRGVEAPAPETDSTAEASEEKNQSVAEQGFHFIAPEN